MNGDPTGATGLVTDDGGRPADHPPRHWSGALDRTADLLQAAFGALLYCNNFEAQEARGLIREAQRHLLSVLEEPAREGERSGEGVHGEDPKAAEVSVVTLDAANDAKF